MHDVSLALALPLTADGRARWLDRVFGECCKPGLGRLDQGFDSVQALRDKLEPAAQQRPWRGDLNDHLVAVGAADLLLRRPRWISS